MVLYSGRSLSQVHYTDREEFPFQVHPRYSPCHITTYITWRIKERRGEGRVLTRDTLRIRQFRHVRNPLTRKTLQELWQGSRALAKKQKGMRGVAYSTLGGLDDRWPCALISFLETYS